MFSCSCSSVTAMDFAARADEYLAAWNERHVDAIRAHLDRSVHPDVVFSDPANRVEGVDALEQLIRTARTDLPDAWYERTSALDGGHDARYRYHWTVHTPDETIVGMDCTTVDAEQRFLRIDGFFGELR
jgi:hypothetical protein